MRRSEYARETCLEMVQEIEYRLVPSLEKNLGICFGDGCVHRSRFSPFPHACEVLISSIQTSVGSAMGYLFECALPCCYVAFQKRNFMVQERRSIREILKAEERP